MAGPGPGSAVEGVGRSWFQLISGFMVQYVQCPAGMAHSMSSVMHIILLVPSHTVSGTIREPQAPLNWVSRPFWPPKSTGGRWFCEGFLKRLRLFLKGTTGFADSQRTVD